MRKLLVILCVFFSTVVSAQQIPNSVVGSNGVFIGFWEYKPADYAANPNTRYPVIIFLHGIAEKGNGSPADLAKISGLALPRMIAQGNPMKFYWNGKWETFIVISPQLSNAYGDWTPFYVEEMIKHATTTLRGDPNRVFLTGLSLGGGAVFRIGSVLANKLAGIAPVCPTCQGVNWQTIASANLPVWTFHAKDDGVASWNCSQGPVNNINSYNPVVKAKATIWADGNHWIWDRAYDPAYNWQSPNLYEWFLGQNKLSPGNAAPVASAGPDVTIGPGGSATFNGSASYDADGGIVRYIWKKIAGPGGGELGSPSSASTGVSGLWNTGIYEYELTVCDSRAVTSTDRISINVVSGGSTTPPPPPPPPPPSTNQPPVPRAGNDATITLPTNSVTLNAASSTDADGSIVKYEWKQVSGPSTASIASVNGTATAVNSLVQGSYTFRLTIWDDKYLPASDDVIITVNAASTSTNQAPVARAGNDATVTGNSATLNGSTSSDADGSIIKYQWTQVSGPSTASIASVNGSSTGVSALVPGKYYFRLTIWDNKYEPATDDVVITVNAPTGNQAPVARAGNDGSITLPTNSITLNGSSSSDADGSIIKYEWKQVTGPSTAAIASVNNASTGVSNLVQGIYYFRLSIWDNKYEPASDDVMIEVKAGTTAPPPPPTGNLVPVAKAGNDISLTLPSSSVNLSGAGSYDPDGTINAYEWRKVSGPSGGNITSSKTSSTSITGLTQGTYTFALRIWDNLWLPSNDDLVVITVNAAAAPAPPPAGNQTPVAKAGNDVVLTLPTNWIKLNGSGSYDPDGTIIKHEWRVESGPASSAFDNINLSSPVVGNLVTGTYTFVLRIWDNQWMPSEDKVVVTVNATATGMASTFAATEASAIVEEALSVTPNPAVSYVVLKMVSATMGTTVVNIYDVNGRVVKQATYSKSFALFQQQIDISSLQTGSYTAEVIINSTKKSLSKFIKQ